MSSISKEDFIVWKNSAITDLLFRSSTQRREEVKEALIISAGTDPIADAVKRGYCQAIVDILNIDFEEIEQDA